jgi:hypothetical protein
MITKHLSVKKKKNQKINPKICIFNSINYNSSGHYSKRTIPISVSPLSANPFSNTHYFNLCISRNINDWNSEKCDGLTFFLLNFKSYLYLSSRSRYQFIPEFFLLFLSIS